MVGNTLKELRKKADLTQQEVATKTGIDRGTYAHYEINRREPDIETLKLLAKFYNVSTDFLMGNEPSVAPSSFLFSTDLQELGRYIHKLVDDAHLAGRFAPTDEKGGLWNAAAQHIGINPEELRALALGEKAKPNQKIIQSIAKKLNGDLEQMLRFAGLLPANTQNAIFKPIKHIPIIGYVPAERLDYEVIMGTVPALLDSPENYALIAKGDSMTELGINDGDKISFSLHAKLQNGKIIVAVIDDSRVELRKYFKTESNIILQPIDSKLPPIVVTEKSNVEIVGVVVNLIKAM